LYIQLLKLKLLHKTVLNFGFFHDFSKENSLFFNLQPTKNISFFYHFIDFKRFLLINELFLFSHNYRLSRTQVK